MVKRIAFIADTPSHPITSGRRTRLINLVENLKSFRSVDVHFVYLNYRNERVDGENQSYWGTCFHNLKIENPVLSFWSMIKPRFRFFANPHNISVDQDFRTELAEKIWQIHQTFHFDIVVSEYVFTSKYLELFEESVLKIVDTHDVYSDRYLEFLRLSLEPPDQSVSKSDEKKALARADVVLAIQCNDAKFFEELTSNTKRVIEIGLINSPKTLPQRVYKGNILFVASNTPWNIRAYDFLVTQIMPELRKLDLKVQLTIVGSLVDHVDKQVDVIYRDYVPDIDELYGQMDIAVNPTDVGSGLKIKTIEALATKCLWLVIHTVLKE